MSYYSIDKDRESRQALRDHGIEPIYGEGAGEGKRPDKVLKNHPDPESFTSSKELSEHRAKVMVELRDGEGGDELAYYDWLGRAGRHLNSLWFGPWSNGKDMSSSMFKAMTNSKGETVYAVGPGQKYSAIPGPAPDGTENPIGSLIQAAITGRREHLSAGVMAALGSGSGPSGGYLLPGELSRVLIDEVRAKMVLSRAGAQTFQIRADSHSFVTVDESAAAEIKYENDLFSVTAPKFGRLDIKPRLLGAFVTTSRELAEDSVNFSAEIQSHLSSVVAHELDRQGIAGNATSGQMNGLLHNDKIDETDSVGALLWSDLAAGALEIRKRNHAANAMIMSPSNWDAVLMTQDSQNRWLGAPPTLDDVSMYDTTAIGNGDVIVGDFRQMGLGVRQDISLEISTDAGEAFQRHQIAIKVWLRANWAVWRPQAFQRLAGVTV